MTPNPLHKLNTIPAPEMVSLRPLAEQQLLRDLPDRIQVGITLIGPPEDPRQRSKVLAAALILMFFFVGLHRVMSGPAHYRHVEACKAVAR